MIRHYEHVRDYHTCRADSPFYFRVSKALVTRWDAVDTTLHILTNMHRSFSITQTLHRQNLGIMQALHSLLHYSNCCLCDSRRQNKACPAPQPQRGPCEKGGTNYQPATIPPSLGPTLWLDLLPDHAPQLMHLAPYTCTCTALQCSPSWFASAAYMRNLETAS